MSAPAGVLRRGERVASRGARTFVIDRDGRHRGLCTLVPGAVRVVLGDDAAVNPWDVDDGATVPAAKVDFLVRVNALLAGGAMSMHERVLLRIAIRDVYARAADAVPSQGFLRAVLADLAGRERADPCGSPDDATTYEGLARRLRQTAAGGRHAALLDRPTRLEIGDAPLVVVATETVAPDIAAVVLLSICELVERLGRRAGGPSVTLLADAFDAAGSDRLPDVFTPGSVLDGLHASYQRRRMRAGEARAMAYLHAISDVAHFLHPPTALSRGAHTTSAVKPTKERGTS